MGRHNSTVCAGLAEGGKPCGNAPGYTARLLFDGRTYRGALPYRRYGSACRLDKIVELSWSPVARVGGYFSFKHIPPDRS